MSTPLDLIEKLRRKSIAYRKRVLLITTSVITGIIFLIWLSTFNPFPKLENSGKDTTVNQFQPIEEIKTNITSFVEATKTMTAGIFGGASSTTTANPNSANSTSNSQ